MLERWLTAYSGLLTDSGSKACKATKAANAGASGDIMISIMIHGPGSCSVEHVKRCVYLQAPIVMSFILPKYSSHTISGMETNTVANNPPATLKAAPTLSTRHRDTLHKSQESFAVPLARDTTRPSCVERRTTPAEKSGEKREFKICLTGAMITAVHRLNSVLTINLLSTVP